MARPLAMVAVVEPLVPALLRVTVEMERFRVVAGDLVADPSMVSTPALVVTVPVDGSEFGHGDELRNPQRRRALHQSHPLGRRN
jgi:hypothetical protein